MLLLPYILKSRFYWCQRKSKQENCDVCRSWTFGLSRMFVARLNRL